MPDKMSKERFLELAELEAECESMSVGMMEEEIKKRVAAIRERMAEENPEVFKQIEAYAKAEASSWNEGTVAYPPGRTREDFILILKAEIEKNKDS